MLIPSHVVFNGKVGALTGDNAMHASQGEKVLFVHSQANRDSRPHLIGGYGDLVWETGKFNTPPGRDLETWFIRGRSAEAGCIPRRCHGSATRTDRRSARYGVRWFASSCGPRQLIMEERRRAGIGEDHQRGSVAGRRCHRTPPVERGLKGHIAKQRLLARAVKPRVEIGRPKLRRAGL